MKIKKKAPLLLMCTLLCMSTFSVAEATKNITIVHTNDVHGRAKGDDKELIGYAKLKTFYDTQKEKNPNTILIDAGDTIHGTIFANISEGENMINLMNEIGFVASVPGNHDFNYGYERLVQLSKNAKFTYLCSNVLKKDKTSDFKANMIQEIDGVKVGIFALATPETRYKSSPKNTENVEFTDYIETAKKQVAELKNQGADIIVAISHLGLDESSIERSDILAEKVDGINLIIDGHSHTKLENGKKVKDTVIVQTGEYLKNIGVVDIVVDDKDVKIKPSLVTFEQAKEIKEDEKIKDIIKSAEEKDKAILEQKIGITETELVGSREQVRVRQTNLGSLVTDAMKKAVDADVALTNGGGIKATINKGDITMGDVLTAFPFTNFVVGLEVKGSDILLALEHGVDKAPESAGKFPHVSGIKFTYDISKQAGKRVSDVMINGQKLDENKTYKLATNDFLSIGGDDYKMFVGAKKYAENALLSDVLVEYIKQNGGKVNYEDIKSNDIQIVNYDLKIGNDTVKLNGYVVNSKLYFKIRDLAAAFDNSKTPFDVSYDKATKSILLKSNTKYTGDKKTVSVDLKKIEKVEKTAQNIKINNSTNKDIVVYNVDGMNYFSLEDIVSNMNLKVK